MHACSRRLVHLAEDEHRLLEDARLLHLEPEVVALTRALTDAAECRQTAVLLREVVDQLLDDDRLTDAGAAEQADLAAFGVRSEQVDDLDAGLKHLGRRAELLDRRRCPVDRPALGLVGDRLTEVDRIAEHVEDAPERLAPDRDRDRSAGVDDLEPTGQSVGRVHRHRAHAVIPEVLLHLEHQQGLLACSDIDVLLSQSGRGTLDRDRVVDLRQLVREHRLNDDALDRLDPAYVLFGCDCHIAPVPVCLSLLSLLLAGRCRQLTPSAPATTSMISAVIAA